MKKLTAAILTCILTLQLCSCGNNAGMSASNATNGIIFGEFEDSGNNPNNLYQSNMAFDEQYMYYSGSIKGFSGVYRMDYTGENITKLLDAGVSNMNIYDGYLYYISSTSMEIRRLDLSSLADEEVYVTSAGKDIKHAGKTYGSYSTIESLFISHGFMFFTVTDGYSGTSEGKYTKTYAYKLDSSDEPQAIGENSGAFTTDGENLYTVSDKTIYKISFDDLEQNLSGAEFERQRGIHACNDDALVFGLNGVICADEDSNYNSYTYDSFNPTEEGSVTGETFYDLNTISMDDALICYGKKFVIGNSMVTTSGKDSKLYFFRNMDFGNPTELDEIGAVMVIGCHDDVVYILEGINGSINLLTVDADANLTRKTINLDEAD